MTWETCRERYGWLCYAAVFVWYLCRLAIGDGVVSRSLLAVAGCIWLVWCVMEIRHYFIKRKKSSIMTEERKS